MSKQFEGLHQEYYQSFYQFEGKSEWMKKIWSEAFGEEFPEGLDHYSYLTRHDLTQIAAKLELPEGASLLDIGCGKGGPGLQLASQLKLRLTGIDIAPGAVAQANAQQKDFDLAHEAHFEVGHFYEIPLPDQSMDAAISIDALWTPPDKIKALTEVRRVLKPGAPFVFTQWDLIAFDPTPLLEQSGMKVVSREDSPNWKEFQLKVYEGILAHEAELQKEMGDAAQVLINEAHTVPRQISRSVRRLYVMVGE